MIKSAATQSDAKILIDLDYHLTTRVPFFQIRNSIGNFTQSVTPIDNWFHFSFRDERAKDVKMVRVQFRHQADGFLTHKAPPDKLWDQSTQ